jgi:predicted TPR repeat methyltransferase
MNPAPPAVHTGSIRLADAERYDDRFESPWGSDAFATERQAILAAAGNLATKSVADIGCGTGRFTVDLERRAGCLVGIDLDASMLAIASPRTAAPLTVADAIDTHGKEPHP